MAIGTGYAWLIAALALLVGGLLGAYLFPTEVTKEVVKTDIKVVEVPVPSETKYEVDPSPSDTATEALYKEIDENEDLWTCGHRDYDPAQISVIRVRSSELTKAYTDDAGEYTITLDARLKYTDGEHQCYDNVDVEVTYDNDHEEPLIEVH